MQRNDKFLSRDRMRYNRNSTSALLAYVSIIFNVFYFINIYNNDVGNYYYSSTIGVSVVCNLLFLLFAFLSSEGIKNYNNKYAVALITLGIFQIVRIFGIPLNAYRATVTLSGETIQVMETRQFVTVTLFLAISAAASIAGGIIGIIKTSMLRSHMKSIEKNK